MASKYIGTIHGVTFAGSRVSFNCNEYYDGNNPHTHSKPESAARCSQTRLRALLPNTSAPASATRLVEVSASVARRNEAGRWVRWAIEQGIVSH